MSAKQAGLSCTLTGSKPLFARHDRYKVVTFGTMQHGSVGLGTLEYRSRRITNGYGIDEKVHTHYNAVVQL